MHRIFSNILGNNNRNSPTQPTFVLPTPQYQQSSSENNNAVDSGRPGCEEPSSAEGRDCVPRALRLSDFRGDVENALVSLHEMEPAVKAIEHLPLLPCAGTPEGVRLRLSIIDCRFPCSYADRSATFKCESLR